MSLKPGQMSKMNKSIRIVVAEDDLDDQMMLREALHENRLANEIHFVENGEELMNYLNRTNQYSDPVISPRPGMILLDLNMPKKDGREALKEIKSNPALRHIPVVVLTTSKAEEDIVRTYNLGVNSFITKPVTFDSLVAVIRDMSRYWLEIVELPPQNL